jgi:hypothetical protein
MRGGKREEGEGLGLHFGSFAFELKLKKSLVLDRKRFFIVLPGRGGHPQPVLLRSISRL